MKIVHYLIEGEMMCPTDPVVQIERTVPVVIVGTEMLVGLFSPGVHQFLLAQPVVFIGSRIYIQGLILVVIGRQGQVQPLREEILLLILQGRHPGMVPSMLFTIDRCLTDTRLNLLIDLGVGECEHQSVSPRTIDHTHLSEDRFIMVIVVKTFHPFQLFGIQPACLKILHRRIHPIAVVGIVLKCLNLIHPPIFPILPEMQIGFVCIERAVGI